jgi:mono/diheme cytochrome c family protein
LNESSRQKRGNGRTTAAGTLLALAVAAVVSRPVPARAADEATLDLYKAKCQACHMAEGNSPIKEMNFADGEWIHGSKLADVIKVIEDGVPGKAMLPFREQLTKEQIEGLAKYVRTFDKKLAAEKGGKGGK